MDATKGASMTDTEISKTIGEKVMGWEPGERFTDWKINGEWHHFAFHPMLLDHDAGIVLDKMAERGDVLVTFLSTPAVWIASFGDGIDTEVSHECADRRRAICIAALKACNAWKWSEKCRKMARSARRELKRGKVKDWPK